MSSKRDYFNSYNNTVTALKNAKAQLILLVNKKTLEYTKKSIVDVQTEVGKPNYVEYIPYTGSFLFGVNCSHEQFNFAVEMLKLVNDETCYSRVWSFCRKWEELTQENGPQVLTLMTIGFVKARINLSYIIENLHPAPLFYKYYDYYHECGLKDRILIVSNDEYLYKFKEAFVNLTNKNQIHKFDITVIDVDEEKNIKVKIPYIFDSIPDNEGLPWIPINKNFSVDEVLPEQGKTVTIFIEWNGKDHVATYGPIST